MWAEGSARRCGPVSGTLRGVYASPLHERLVLAVGQRSIRHVGELTGTNHETVRRYLSGQPPSAEFLAALCRVLGLNANWLLTGRGPMKVEEVRLEALRESPAPDLLTALAATVENLLDRVERVELFVQTLETRLRGQTVSGGTDASSSAADRSSAARIAGAIPPPAGSSQDAD